jgi:hypothetical protein
MPVFRGGEFIGEIGFEKVLLWEVYKEIKGNLIGLNRSSRGGATRKNLRNLRKKNSKLPDGFTPAVKAPSINAATDLAIICVICVICGQKNQAYPP